jgi:competence protein ComEC
MAISGLHIGMVAAVFAWLARVLWRRCQLRGAVGATRDAAVIAGTVAAAAYSALAGASVPTQRTLIMIAVAAAAFHRRRNASVVDGLSVAVLAVLALDPLAPLAPGFWLSFGAVAAIVSVMNGHIVRPPRG